MDNIIIEPFKIIGIAIRTTNENNQAATDIGILWGKFMGENVIAAIPNKALFIQNMKVTLQNHIQQCLAARLIA